MKTCQILLALVPALLVYQAKCEDLVEIQAQSSQQFVPFNESIWLNCSTNAPDDTVYESRLRKINFTTGANWVATEVLVDDWTNSTVYCFYTGDRKAVTTASPTTVMAYAVPSNVTIDMVTEVEEGKEYAIKCTVHEVAPLEYLTLNVYRGQEVIDSKSYNGPHVVGKQTRSHVHTYTANRRDNHENFHCEAVLQLGSEATRVESLALTVQTYALPEAPAIFVHKWIEKGTLIPVQCVISGAFPPENVNLKMIFEDSQPDVDITRHETVINVTATLNATYDVGLNTIRCESNLFTLTKDAKMEVNIYERPTLSFNLSSNIVDLDEKVTASCIITNADPQDYDLSIIVDGKEKLTVKNSTVIHEITAKQRTPDSTIKCVAHIINSTISTFSKQTLEVHYPPEFTETLCPSTLLLVEGGKPFLCSADGNPLPTVKCSNGNHNINDLGMVTRDMSGSYVCQATNAKGNILKVVNVTVQYAPLSPTVSLSTNATIQTGNPLNITCESDGFPAPKYSWQIPNDAEVTYSPDNSSVIIHTTTWSHNGTYTCVASNTHGEAKSKQEVTIKPAEVNIALIVGVVALIVLLAFGAAILGYAHWKKGRKGSYSVLNGKPGQHNLPSDPTNNKTTGV